MAKSVSEVISPRNTPPPSPPPPPLTWNTPPPLTKSTPLIPYLTASLFSFSKFTPRVTIMLALYNNVL